MKPEYNYIIYKVHQPKFEDQYKCAVDVYIKHSANKYYKNWIFYDFPVNSTVEHTIDYIKQNPRILLLYRNPDARNEWIHL